MHRRCRAHRRNDHRVERLERHRAAIARYDVHGPVRQREVAVEAALDLDDQRRSSRDPLEEARQARDPVRGAADRDFGQLAR